MLHRIKKENDYHEGKWNGLGGKAEQGESPKDCIIREIKEESGLDIKNPKLNGFITFPEFNKNDDWLVFIYTITEFSGKLIECNEGNLEWIDDDKVMDLNLWDGDKIFLKWIQEGKFFSAKFNYENKKLKDYTYEFHNEN